MIGHSYYVVMRDFGRLGREAVVDPEITRRDVVSRIRSGEYKDVAFVHHVDVPFGVADITDELLAEAYATEDAQ